MERSASACSVAICAFICSACVTSYVQCQHLLGYQHYCFQQLVEELHLEAFLSRILKSCLCIKFSHLLWASLPVSMPWDNIVNLIRTCARCVEGRHHNNILCETFFIKPSWCSMLRIVCPSVPVIPCSASPVFCFLSFYTQGWRSSNHHALFALV